MKDFGKMILLWQYYGTRGIYDKVVEKWIVDRRRFGRKLVGATPSANITFIEEIHDIYEHDNYSSVCYLTHCFYPDKEGGTERFVMNMAKAQQQKGKRVRVITLGLRAINEYNGCVGDILYRDYEFNGVPVTEFRYRKAPMGLYYQRMEEYDIDVEAFAKVVFERELFDLVHCAFPQPFVTFLRVCHEIKIPYLVTNTGYCIFCHYTTMIDRKGELCSGCEEGKKCALVCPVRGVGDPLKRYGVSKKLLANAVYITAPSVFVAKIIEQEYPGVQVRVINHGVSKDFSRYYKTGNVKKFAFVGTFTRMKGIHTLIKAFKRLDGDFILELYGKGDIFYENELRILSNSDKRISFKGSVDSLSIAKVYSKIDCVIIPSIVPETYNFVVREAIQSGCYVIAAQIGALPEAVSINKNGLLFSPGDETDLHKKMQRICSFRMENHEYREFQTIEDESRIYSNLYVKSLLEESK